MKKIAVVTVNFNTPDDTLEFLKSLKKADSTGLDIQTIVVDNGSKEKLTLEPKENILLIRSDENLGFSGGYNLGIKEGMRKGADHILIINNDTLLEPELIRRLVSVLEKEERVGAVTPKIYFAKGREYHLDRYKKEELGKVLWFAGGYIDWKNIKSIHRGLDEVDHGQYDNEEKTGFATGCCIMLKKEVLEKVGLLDDKYFLYYEDADLCERIKRGGYEIRYVPEAVLVHINASSSGGPGNVLHDYFLTRNQMLFGMKYAPLRSKAALLRQAFRLLRSGRPFQKLAIRDFFTGEFNKGSFFKKHE